MSISATPVSSEAILATLGDKQADIRLSVTENLICLGILGIHEINDTITNKNLVLMVPDEHSNTQTL